VVTCRDNLAERFKTLSGRFMTRSLSRSMRTGFNATVVRPNFGPDHPRNVLLVCLLAFLSGLCSGTGRVGFGFFLGCVALCVGLVLLRFAFSD